MTENPDLLAYLGRRFDTAALDGQIWFRADELGRALGLAEPERDVLRVHQSGWQQFSDRLTVFMPVETPEGPRLMRAFNLLGAYVLATFCLSHDALQFRRWLLETLVFHQIDVRREMQRLLERNAALEGRVAALEADVAAIRQALGRAERPAPAAPDGWLEGEFSALREHQQRVADTFSDAANTLCGMAQRLAEALPRTPPDTGLDRLCPLRIPDMDGPFPVCVTYIGGRECLAVNARDLHAFLNVRQDYGDWVVLETAGRANTTHILWRHAEGMRATPFLNCLVSFDAALEIIGDRHGHQGDIARSHLLECLRMAAAWMAANSPAPPPWPDVPPDGAPLVFYFGETPLTVVMRAGDPWFVAKEVCDALGIANSRDAATVLDDDEKADVGLTDTSSNGVTQQRTVTIISDSGFYTLAIRCRDAIKPGTTAYAFRRWVTREVLPRIRRIGRYRQPDHGDIAAPAPVDTAGCPTPPALAAKPPQTQPKRKPKGKPADDGEGA